MHGLDTNILVRYIVQDDQAQAKKAGFIVESFTREDPAFITTIVLCELNWVLKSSYKVSKANRIKTLEQLLCTDVFKFENYHCCLRALTSYKKGKADFSDFLIAEISKKEGIKSVITLDNIAAKEDGFEKSLK